MKIESRNLEKSMYDMSSYLLYHTAVVCCGGGDDTPNERSTPNTIIVGYTILSACRPPVREFNVGIVCFARRFGSLLEGGLCALVNRGACLVPSTLPLSAPATFTDRSNLT